MSEPKDKHERADLLKDRLEAEAKAREAEKKANEPGPRVAKEVNVESVIEKCCKDETSRVVFKAPPGSLPSFAGNNVVWWPIISQLLKDFGLEFAQENLPILRQKVEESWNPTNWAGKFLKKLLLEAIDTLYSLVRDGKISFTEDFVG